MPSHSRRTSGGNSSGSKQSEYFRNISIVENEYRRSGVGHQNETQVMAGSGDQLLRTQTPSFHHQSKSLSLDTDSSSVKSSSTHNRSQSAFSIGSVFSSPFKSLRRLSSGSSGSKSVLSLDPMDDMGVNPLSRSPISPATPTTPMLPTPNQLLQQDSDSESDSGSIQSSESGTSPLRTNRTPSPRTRPPTLPPMPAQPLRSRRRPPPPSSSLVHANRAGSLPHTASLIEESRIGSMTGSISSQVGPSVAGSVSSNIGASVAGSVSSVGMSLFHTRQGSVQSSVRYSPVPVLKLPADIRILEGSKLAVKYSFDTFENTQYKDFWGLTEEEVQTFKDWNKLEFERQNQLFEYFSQLQRIRANMKRMVTYYGPLFKRTRGLTSNQDDDYSKTFVVLESLYKFIDHQVSKKLLPPYEGHMFVEDHYVLALSRKWFAKVAEKYEYISRSVVYLARLSSNERVRNWIAQVEQNDPAVDNRFLSPAKELFSSYFIKVFTSMPLIFGNLRGIYEKLQEQGQSPMPLTDQISMVDDICASLEKINSTSDYTTDLDAKIRLNEKLTCKDYLYLEMVDLFNKERHLDSFTLELKDDAVKGHALSGQECKLLFCDNYVLHMQLRKRKESLFLDKPPVPLQYLKYEIGHDSYGERLVMVDCGNKIIHQMHMDTPTASYMLKTFKRKVDESRRNLFAKFAQSGYKLRLINASAFNGSNSNPYNRGESRQYCPEPGPEEFDLVSAGWNASSESKLQKTHKPLSSFGPNCMGTFDHQSEAYYIVGGEDGIFVGQQDSPASWKRVCKQMLWVRQLEVLDNEQVVCFRDNKVLRCSVSAILEAYHKSQFCDKSFVEVARRCKGFVVGENQERVGPVITISRYIFTWKDRKIKYSQFHRDNSWRPNFQAMRSPFDIERMCILPPKYFVIMHYVDDSALFYRSELNSQDNTPLPKTDTDGEMRLRQKNQHPVGVYMIQNSGKHNDYELLLVYTRYSIIVSYDFKSNSFLRSRTDILRFNFECKESAFDHQTRTLFACGPQSLEVWSVPQRGAVRGDGAAKPEMVACVTGMKVKLLSKNPGKLFVSVLREEHTLLFQLERPNM